MSRDSPKRCRVEQDVLLFWRAFLECVVSSCRPEAATCRPKNDATVMTTAANGHWSIKIGIECDEYEEAVCLCVRFSFAETAWAVLCRDQGWACPAPPLRYLPKKHGEADRAKPCRAVGTRSGVSASPKHTISESLGRHCGASCRLYHFAPFGDDSAGSGAIELRTTV